MQTERVEFALPRPSVQPRRERGMAQRIVTGFLTALLAVLVVALALVAVTPAIAPVFAGNPDHTRHNVEQRQGQDVSAEKRGKGKKNGSKTVKKTFSNGGAIEIIDNSAANPYPATIAANGFKKARISDVNLTLRGFRAGCG